MPDAPKSAPKSSPKGKRPLGLSPITLGLIGLSGVGIYVYLRRRASASAANAATGTTGGNTIPAGTVGSPISGTSTVTAPTTLAGWISDALSQVTNATYTPTQALNDVNSWLGGQCVSSAGYSALGGLVESLGVPPGYSTTPPITVCASSPPVGVVVPQGATTTTTTTTAPASTTAPGPPPGLSGALAQSAAADGGIVSTVFQPVTGTWLYLTKNGGIYTQGGTGFFGSLYDLLPSTFTGTGRQAASLVANPDGGYTVVDTAGETYTFGPNQNYAGVIPGGTAPSQALSANVKSAAG